MSDITTQALLAARRHSTPVLAATALISIALGIWLVGCSNKCDRAAKAYRESREASARYERTLIEFLGPEYPVYPGGIVAELAAFCETREESEGVMALRDQHGASRRTLRRELCEPAQGMIAEADRSVATVTAIGQTCGLHDGGSAASSPSDPNASN